MNSIRCKVFRNGSTTFSLIGCFLCFLTPVRRVTLEVPFCSLSPHMAFPAAFMNTFLYYLVARTLASKPYLMSGTFTYEMTANLGCLNPHAIRSLKKVFKVILQSTFWHRFSFGCPSYISSIRSLSFLPHALGCEGGWRQISVSFLRHALELTTQDLNAYCESPLSIRARYPTGHWIVERALEHRLSTHQGLPTRLRHLSCWNINSWQYPKPPQGDSKMRWVKRLVRKGPVLLQETKWTGGQEEILAQYLPGVTVCSAPPIYTELGNPSGGTTVLVPAGWQVGEKTVLIPGKAVAVLLTDRCCQFYLVSVYLHPDHVKEDLRELVIFFFAA